MRSVPAGTFPDAVIINAAWGLGESVVKGAVTPDCFVAVKRRVAAAEGRLV